MLISIKTIVGTSLFLYLFSYIFFSKNVMDMSFLSTFKTVLIGAICFFMCQRNKKNVNALGNETLALFPIMSIFLTVQLICFFPLSSLLKLMVNCFFFLCLAKFSDKFLSSLFDFGIKIIALIVCIGVAYFCIVNGRLSFFRDSVFFEKQLASMIFCLALTFCFVDVFFEKKSNLNMIILSLILFFDLFVIQSKSSIFVAGLNVLLLCFVFKQVRFWIKRKIIPIICTFSIILLMFPSFALPDDVRFGINRILGSEVFSTHYTRQIDRMDLTYSIREDLKEYCFSLFSNNPITGIGLDKFSEYSKYGKSSFRGIGQTESQWLGILVEGGIPYALFFIVFFVININTSYTALKVRRDTDALKSFLLNINYPIMFVFNDFLDSLFWVSTGIFVGAAKRIDLTKNSELL